MKPTPAQCLAMARDLAKDVSPRAQEICCLDWPDDAPDPETVAWVLAIMLSITYEGLGAGYLRLPPVTTPRPGKPPAKAVS